MYPVERALWFIENRISKDVSLQAIAASAGVSSHHLARAFGAATGQSFGNADNSGSFEYIAGVKVTEFSDLPGGFATVRISAQRYAIFRHPAHVAMLRRTHYTIWNNWLPASDVKITDGPSFERYGKDFNPITGTGTIEVWMPVSESRT